MVGALVVLGCAVCWVLLIFIFFHRFEHVGRGKPHAPPAAAAQQAKPGETR
ncbi:hypothetical protein BH09PSE2_BH09PSE2_04580 [soil metagenome]